MDYKLSWDSVADPASDYPLVVKGFFQKNIKPHCHEFYEIVYVADGFCLHVFNGEVSLLMAGDLVAIRPGEEHSYRCQRYVSIYNLLFMPDALDGFSKELQALPCLAEFFGGASGASHPFHSHLTLKDREEARALLGSMQRELAGKDSGWRLAAKSDLARFMVLFSRVFEARFPEKQAQSPYLGYVSAAVSLIEARYGEDISVAQIAGELGISPDYFTRQFKQVIGITPIEHLRRYRFAKALDLLRSQQPVGKVCAAVGFHHLSHFSREFKTLFDMTPTAFQKKARERSQAQSEAEFAETAVESGEL